MTRNVPSPLPSISEESSNNDPTPGDRADSSIVMAEQSSHDVVTQTRSGGEPSPSDVPASNSDKKTAGGDVGEIKDTTTTENTERQTNAEQHEWKTSISNASSGANEVRTTSGHPATENGKDGPGPVEARALELNGVASASDRGEDTGSQGGSESDTSRTDGRHHTRTGSVKKPTTFKPVSFAKFTVPKAPGSTISSKASDKASLSSTSSSTPLQSSRPRLVAKTTSGLRDSASKASVAGAGSGMGPDPNQVWNKNRPTQPTTTKHLTDEELKQQYGIHMTSRIQEDGGGGSEAKWADIDDDEEDWAPETIEWNDGTKITLTTHTEDITTTSQEAQGSKDSEDAAPPSEQAATRETTRIVTTKSTTSVGPNATVLRLGASAERQAKSASASKGPNDRSTLTSKSPAPVPVRSPWAPLPPVEKISPIHTQVQTYSSSRFLRRDSHGHDAGNGPLPAKEIAADDFNRSWRDGQSNLPRELYNSQSGRYEPVSDTRKAPLRHEQAFRAPSLLQRPSHNEQTGPAEPSAAFQTHRSSGQDTGHWPRRRTSSNVSGGSGSFGRRMSLGRPDAFPKPSDSRRGSQVNGMIERSVSPSDIPPKGTVQRGVSPGQQAAGTTWQSRTSTNVSYALPGSNVDASQTAGSSTSEEPAGVAPAPEEDPVAMQQRIMKEKTMEARQRRREQEEKEEAERRERIRLKLEALGPPPSEKEKPKAEEPSTAAKAAAKETAAATSQSPPKPPVPEPTGEPKQYGMMKVHHPDTVKKLVAASERVPEKSTSAPHGRRLPSPMREPKSDAPKANGLRQSSEPSPTQPLAAHAEPVANDQGPQWRGDLNTSSSYSPWVSAPKISGHPSTGANPWKPLSTDKTLGNGTFDRNLPGFAARELSLRGHLGLGDQPPIGPLSASNDRIGGPQPFSGSPRIAQDSIPISPLPESINAIVRPGPIGPPSSQPSHRQREPRRASETAAWHNFHNIATKKEAEENEKFHRELAAMRDDAPSSVPVSFNETWRQVRTGDQTGQRQVVGVTRTTDNGGALSPLHGFDPAVGSLPLSENHSRPFSNVTGRGSRFFPHPAEQAKRPVSQDGGLARSPSPPPPEEISSHPVYTGDSSRPLVHLPTPKPVVKLPPKPTSSPRPVTFASMVASTTPVRVIPQPIASTTSWQDRFNGLFGKKPSTDKKHVLAVTSATKEPLDVQSHPAPAAVSLPQYVESDVLRDAGKVTSKRVEEEEEIFEDREAGSLPVVRVPNMAPPAAWHAALPPPAARLRSKYLKPMQVHSIEPYAFAFQDKDHSGNLHVTVHFPGSDNMKTVTLPRKAGSHAPRQRGGASTFKSRKNTKNSREGSGSFNNSQNSKKQNPSGSANANAGSARAPFGNASWSPRAFGVAH